MFNMTPIFTERNRLVGTTNAAMYDALEVLKKKIPAILCRERAICWIALDVQCPHVEGFGSFALIYDFMASVKPEEVGVLHFLGQLVLLVNF